MTPQQQVEDIRDSINLTTHAFDLEPVNAYRLALRLERRQRANDGQVLPIYVYAQGVCHLYGGPEEGGWYYDQRRLLEVRRAFSWQTARRYARELREEYPTCPYGRFSVLGGEDVLIRFASDDSFIPEDTGHPGPWC